MPSYCSQSFSFAEGTGVSAVSVRIKVPLSGEGRFDSTEVEKDSNTLQGIRTVWLK